jgi:hypothetical protein
MKILMFFRFVIQIKNTCKNLNCLKNHVVIFYIFLSNQIITLIGKMILAQF